VRLRVYGEEVTETVLHEAAGRCVSKPLVSVPLAAKELKVSTQAIEGMMGQLGSSARELTGRGRYRAWGII
jgi:hypothetical protein